MRICTPQLGISPTATLGGEVFDREMLTHMAALGDEIDILLPAGLTHADLPNWDVTHLPLRRGYRWFVSNTIFVPYIGQAYKKRPFDILRVHSPRFIGLAALAAKRLYRLSTPIVVHHHHLDKDRWSLPVDKRVMRNTDLTIVGSTFAKQQLVDQLSIPAHKIEVIYYGVDEQYRPNLARRQQVREQNKWQDKQIILHIGSYIPRKNLPHLLKAFKTILTQKPQTHLVLVGRGPLEAELKQQAHTLSLTNNVTFAVNVPQAQKFDYLQAADLYISTSLMEGFGLAVAEAMACGKPVVACKVGSLPEVIAEGETGLFVPTTDGDALVQASLQLINDPAQAQAMGQAGLNRVNTLFRWSRMAQNAHKLYMHLL